ncbi:MAG: roadblock/LC7 domain-containing protein [Candidatus Micrarchaeota archaeon]|nr:roadblock/LC7 domain-containing protein [Candidatus Micrarchaeota archaeon]
MGNRFVLLIIMVLALIFTSGCIQKNIYPSEKETIQTERSVDLNNDGIPDEIIYVFAPKEIQTVTMTREIIVQKNMGNEVTVKINLVSKATDKITDITLKETIPASLALNLEKLEFVTKYSEILRAEPPITVSWKFTFSGSEDIGKTIIYKTTVFQEINKAWVEKYVQSAYLELSTVDPKNVPFFMSVAKFGESVYSVLKANLDFYVASAVYGTMIFIAVLVYLELLALIGAYASSALKKTPLMSEIYNFIGHGRKDNLIWIGTGIFAIVVGLVIIFFTKEIPGSPEMETLVRLGSNVPKLIGAFAISIGIISLYYSILDIIKGAIFGERYYMSPMEMAKEKIKDAMACIDALEDKIMAAAENKIDTESEEIFAQVERKRMERYMQEITQENAEQYLAQINKSIADIQAAIDGLATKGEILNNWPKWRMQIDELLKDNDRVEIGMLKDIPARWRKWALTRYISEHIGESLTIEEGALKRIKAVVIDKNEVTQVLNSLLSGGKIEGVAAVRKDGLLITSMLPKEIDSNLVAAVAAKVIANSDMASMEFEKGQSRYAILKGAEGDALIYNGRSVILVSLIRKGESIGFIVSEMKKAADKLDALIS